MYKQWEFFVIVMDTLGPWIPEVSTIQSLGTYVCSTAMYFYDFMHYSILDKMVFCLGEKQGMIVNNDCNSWYKRIGDF